MSVLNIKTAEVFEPFLKQARYKAAWGGRGSGKSHNFGESLIDDALRFPGDAGEGLRAVCLREVQKTLKESSKRLLEDKLTKFGLTERDGFKVFNEVIQTPKDGLIIFNGMQDHTADSVKSLEGYHRGWFEEAQNCSSRSLSLLRPTIRWENQSLGLISELWFGWNPRRKSDAVDRLFRSSTPPTDSVVIKANWRDNPWFPNVLEQERLDCLKNQPEEYDHIWEGGYATILSGAYYAEGLARARKDGRICRVPHDPLMTIRLFVDIGGTGARADAFTIWVCQFIGKEIRVLDYYESVGQPLAAHLGWLREKDYTPKRAQFWLPHDGAQNDKVHAVSYESSLREAGYKVTVVPNQGKGAAKQRIEAGRRLFPSIWFNEDTTEAGRDALGWYHEKRDDDRNIGLGPEHDWASHGADSFGLMCIAYEEPKKLTPIKYPNQGIV